MGKVVCNRKDENKSYNLIWLSNFTRGIFYSLAVEVSSVSLKWPQHPKCKTDSKILLTIVCTRRTSLKGLPSFLHLHLLFHIIQQITCCVENWSFFFSFHVLFVLRFNSILRDCSSNVLTSSPNLFCWSFKVIKVVAGFFTQLVNSIKNTKGDLLFLFCFVFFIDWFHIFTAIITRGPTNRKSRMKNAQGETQHQVSMSRSKMGSVRQKIHGLGHLPTISQSEWYGHFVEHNLISCLSYCSCVPSQY